MSDINLSDIDGAISNLERLAEFYFNNTRGPDAYDNYKHYKLSAERAGKAMRQLDSVWSEFRSFQSTRAEAYDRYVTSERGVESCSCHISAPCSYCMRKVDADAEESQS